MVLEEIDRARDGSQDASFSESLPTNDADPYAGDHTPTILSGRSPKYIPVNSPPYQVYVNLDNVPQALFGPWSPRNLSTLGKATRDTCKQASDLLGRPVNQQEADALAFHLARGFRISGYGAPAGIAVTTYLAYRGWSKMRFPGWTPGEKWNLDKFGPLRGTYARAMWHSARFNAYWLIGVVAGTIFFGSYALTVGSAGRMMDPRLKELAEVIKTRAKSGRPMPSSSESDQTAGPRNGETMDMAKQRRRAQEAQDAWRRRRQEATGQSSASTHGDDMSPTGGAFGAEYVDLGSANVTDTGMMSDDQARRSSERLEAQQRADYAERTEPPRSAPQSRPQRAESSSQTSQTESTPKSSGSAWERLRQQAASGNQQQTSSRGAASSRGSSSIDSFAFSSSDEEKQLARGEAQRDFDARLELERQGKDFDERRSGRRW